ncbi:DUF262 domain-containing protein [Myxococcus qinghaiensis]|uniref:DUF262 domain-containing protein n=1 Tax=Myxococcus qinghaiensis TaxID=2906758 RepID=UPI0020A7A3E7|nr:DUF262 domain-containing protein [Myxococcus qinghaiensis]MCP3166208.1 DUF262 domain-containing protein [Myxococcus qinghaiensis]
MPPTLTRRPQATAFSIEDLMDKVQRGEVRIPAFQRPLKWTSEDIRALFDSVYRGYPIGTLLFWKREAPAASLHYGPAHIDAPSSSQALWVVDGQQRISSLTSVLLRKGTGAEGGLDDFSIFFDLETAELIHPMEEQSIQAHWLPLNVTLDSEHLLDWLNRYPGRAQHPEHTKAAIRFGKALREFQLPAYIVDADEEQTLRIIFKRLNTSGKPLTQEEVFNALYGSTSGSRQLDLQSMSRDLEDMGFGTFDEVLLVKAVLAVQGLDFTQDFQTQLREDDNLTSSLIGTDKALRDAIIFLKRDAGIPHSIFLPSMENPILLLARFFYLHPTPSPRSRELLSRWFWRDLITRSFWLDPTRPGQELAKAVDTNEDSSIQHLLSSIPGSRASITNNLLKAIHEQTQRGEFVGFLWSIIDSWVAFSLLEFHPRHLLTGSILDAELLLNEQGENALTPILPPHETASDNEREESWRKSIVNQLFHPQLPQSPILDVLRSNEELEPRILQSHLITPEARSALQQGRDEAFLELRARSIATHLHTFIRAKTRWDESDRPSIQSLVISDEDD